MMADEQRALCQMFPQGHSSDLSLTINEINVDVRATANTPQPTVKINKSLLGMMSAPQHECPEAEDRRDPQPHEHSFLFTAGEPQGY